MIQQNTLIKIGGSYYLKITQEAKKLLEANEGDIIVFDLIKTIKPENDIKSYRCLVCNHFFDQNDEEQFCPACGNEDKYSIELLEQ